MARWTETLKRWTQPIPTDELRARLEATRPPAEYGVDPFGFDLDYSLSMVTPFIWLYQNYFRCEVRGLENVPRGRVLLISNHSGQLPADGAMIAVAMLLQADPPRIVRAMVEKWVPTLPFVSTFFARVGQIVGTPENCRRLLERDEAILVFPEGIKGISKLYSQRYQLQDFGLGFMRLALQTRTPIVPVSVVGAEEQAPAFTNLASIAKLVGLPVLPVTPQVVPLPLPTKYRITFGEPLVFTGSHEDDDAELEKKVTAVKATIQRMLEQSLTERKAVFW
ncbi:MAG: acyltransferase family protein [Archangium sp.]|nr:acyltransferase family protein [Archangium sp.]